MDVIFFGGQSNMEGQADKIPSDTSPVPGAVEYKFLTNTFVPLQHPAGEDVPPHLFGANYGHGSLLPDFCRSYLSVSHSKVAAVHAAKGATALAEWMPGGELYAAAVKKQQAALEALGDQVDRVFYVWLQGESDAILGVSEEEYLKKLIEYKNALKKDCRIEKFGIIRVGYFAGDAADEVIMNAQERAVKEDSDFLMLTRITAQLSKDPKFLNPEAAGHYNNEGLALIGKEAGAALGCYAVQAK